MVPGFDAFGAGPALERRHIAPNAGPFRDQKNPRFASERLTKMFFIWL